MLAALPGLVPGSSPDVREIGREIALANEHPARRLAVIMKEGQAPDTVDAEVRVRDAAPGQTLVSLSGQTRDQYDEINRNTGYTRVSIAHQRSDLFDLDHALTAVYTTSPDETRKVGQLGLFYWIPLYGHHASVQFHYTRSDVNTGVIGAGLSGADFNVSGRGEFLGVRATYDLPKWGSTAQTLSAALEDKHYASSVGLNIGAVALALPTPDIHARPLSLRYALREQQASRFADGDAAASEHLSHRRIGQERPHGPVIEPRDAHGDGPRADRGQERPHGARGGQDPGVREARCAACADQRAVPQGR